MILSGLASIEDKNKGLGLGADDYVSKPFRKDELVARIQAIVPRSQGHAQSLITIGSLVVNLDSKTVSVNDVRINLTGKEYQMGIEAIYRRPNTSKLAPGTRLTPICCAA